MFGPVLRTPPLIEQPLRPHGGLYGWSQGNGRLPDVPWRHEGPGKAESRSCILEVGHLRSSPAVASFHSANTQFGEYTPDCPTAEAEWGIVSNDSNPSQDGS